MGAINAAAARCITLNINIKQKERTASRYDNDRERGMQTRGHVCLEGDAHTFPCKTTCDASNTFPFSKPLMYVSMFNRIPDFNPGMRPPVSFGCCHKMLDTCVALARGRSFRCDFVAEVLRMRLFALFWRGLSKQGLELECQSLLQPPHLCMREF